MGEGRAPERMENGNEITRRSGESQEQTDETKAQAAEREHQDDAYWWWFWTHQLLTNMGAAGE